MTRRFLLIRTTNDWLRASASSSKLYSGLTALREEEALDRAGEESHVSKDRVGE